MPIRVLDKEVVSQIAAGEVVERPASVVKELVENSLDAGSNQVTIEVRGGGVSLIRVTDNGVGIPAEEVELAFDRYATSKIGNLADLESIHSLGFRGEALPSIAAVAQVDVITYAPAESVGSHISLRDGVIMQRGRQGRSPGTTITVRNLFRQFPARLKFLKSPTTENTHIVHVISQYALAFPEVKFTLTIDGRVALRTAGSGRLIDSVIQVYGSAVARNMLEIGSGNEEWESGTTVAAPLITGMIGSPAISRASRSYLSFFVNRRWINNRLLVWAVEEAYHGLLMTGKHPIAVVNISLLPNEVDVNIHPAKAEVKFQKERDIFRAVQKVVRGTLIKLAPIPTIEEAVATYEASTVSQPALWTSAGRNHSSGQLYVMPETPLVSLPALRVLGQLSGSYIVAEGPEGLYLVDQHAAHERIIFDQLKQQSSLKEVEVQGLLEPVTLEVSPQQNEFMKSHYESLAEFGFSIEPFGDQTYLVRAIPIWLHQHDWVGMLRDLMDSLFGGFKGDWREETAISIACHSAVMAGQTLTDEEMRELIRQLEKADIPNTCPHGRPTMIRFSSEQLNKEFGRS